MDVLNLEGLLYGVVAFVCIGVFHPLVVKAELYWGRKSWIAFAVLGVVSLLVSVFSPTNLVSIISGVTAFSSFWSVFEVFEQEKRVAQGRYPNRKPKNQ